MFISLSRTYVHNFSNWHALFLFFFSHSVAVAAWCGTRRVDPQMIHFELFYHLGHRSQLNPKQYLFTFGSWKKNIYFGHSSTKDNHPGPLLQQGFCTSSEIWHELSVTWQIKWRLFFLVLPSQRPPILNIRSLFTNPCNRRAFCMRMRESAERQ